MTDTYELVILARPVIIKQVERAAPNYLTRDRLNGIARYLYGDEAVVTVGAENVSQVNEARLEWGNDDLSVQVQWHFVRSGPLSKRTYDLTVIFLMLSTPSILVYNNSIKV